MTEEFYIGQIFENTYPSEAAQWCNDRGDCFIEEIESIAKEVEEIPSEEEGGNLISGTQTQTGVVRRFEIKAVPPETEEEKRERLNQLSMTRGDMFEAIILAFGKTKANLRTMIENEESLSNVERTLYLNRFDEALEFYRGYPAVDLIGQKLGISPEQLDKFFETKDYHELLPAEPETTED